MDCALTTLHTLIACFNWAGLYVDGGLIYQDEGQAEVRREPFATTTDGATIYTQSVIDSPSNPYGRLSLGYQLQFESFSLALEAAHRSSLASSADRGVNSIELRARWYPFKH